MPQPGIATSWRCRSRRCSSTTWAAFTRGAQFALAEACSGAFLQRHLDDGQNQVLAVLRTSDVKFRNPAHGCLRASAQFGGASAESLSSQLAARGRTLASVLVEVSDTQGVITMKGCYHWFLQLRML